MTPPRADSARCNVTTSSTSRNVPSTRSLATIWSMSGYSPPGKSCSMSRSRRISSAKASRRSISRGEVENCSEAIRSRAARMVQRAATCSRSRSKPIFCSKEAGYIIAVKLTFHRPQAPPGAGSTLLRNGIRSGERADVPSRRLRRRRGTAAHCARFRESRSARAASLAALRSALAFIFSGSRPKSEKCT